jgi:hypothetical protein
MTSVPSELYHHQSKKQKKSFYQYFIYLDYNQPLPLSMNNIEDTKEVISNTSQRELGIIEKLCSTYGFVYCCHRDGRYFFHFSEYKDDIQQAKIGGNEINYLESRI